MRKLVVLFLVLTGCPDAVTVGELCTRAATAICERDAKCGAPAASCVEDHMAACCVGNTCSAEAGHGIDQVDESLLRQMEICENLMSAGTCSTEIPQQCCVGSLCD